eukprot:7915409-Alexandrium_andersonii.AAC.1
MSKPICLLRAIRAARTTTATWAGATWRLRPEAGRRRPSRATSRSRRPRSSASLPPPASRAPSRPAAGARSRRRG